MSELTLLNAYVLARDKIQHCRSQRRTTYGIAVDNDQIALEFQKRSRQAGRFLSVLEKKLQTTRTANKALNTDF